MAHLLGSQLRGPIPSRQQRQSGGHWSPDGQITLRARKQQSIKSGARPSIETLFPPSNSLPPPEFHFFRVPKFSNSTLTWEPSDKHKPYGGHIVNKGPSLMESLKERWLIRDEILIRGRICRSIASRLFSSARVLSTLSSLSLDTCTCVVSHVCISGSTGP